MCFCTLFYVCFYDSASCVASEKTSIFLLYSTLGMSAIFEKEGNHKTSTTLLVLFPRGPRDRVLDDFGIVLENARISPRV